MRILLRTVVCSACLFAASGAPIVNSFGLSSPGAVVTFSELSFPAGTLITNQFAAYGVTTSGHNYNSQDFAPFPGITGDYIGRPSGNGFTLSFGQTVSEAAFGYAKNPVTVLVEALLGNAVVESFQQAVTYDNPNTAFLGFSGIVFDTIRVTAGTNEGLVDNVQFTSASEVPEPAAAVLMSAGLLALALLRRRRRA